MSIYYFAITGSGLPTGETDGLVFSDDQAAWEEAAISSCEIIRDMKGRVEPGLDWQMEVRDETGQPIYRLRFTAEAIATAQAVAA